MSIGLEFAFEAFVSIGEDLVIGPVPGGVRDIIPITGGRFEGRGIRGTVVPGGADWSINRDDGVTEICARYTLKTDDGVLIYVVNRGLFIGQPVDQESPAEGERDDFLVEYFRTTPHFEVSDEKYAWLNRTLFVGELELIMNKEHPQYPGIAVKFYKVT